MTDWTEHQQQQLELVKCPCSGTPSLVSARTHSGGETVRTWAVRCSECQIQTGFYADWDENDSKLKAFNAWINFVNRVDETRLP